MVTRAFVYDDDCSKIVEIDVVGVVANASGWTSSIMDVVRASSCYCIGGLR